MLSQIKKTIRARDLVSKGDRVLLAVSGGADSMALLVAMCELRRELGVRLAVAHLDHGIRKDSGEDARFVAAEARRRRLPFFTERVHVRTRAKRRGVSLEMAAREARYDFFLRTARTWKADAVATAHTADDQAETMVLRLARGTGPQGLAGIGPVGDWKGVRIVRPMLDVARRQVESWLQRKGVAWREDSSNLDPAHLRNRVRHEVLPLLGDRLNPRVMEALCRTAALMRDENEWLDAWTEDMLLACTSGSEGIRLLSKELMGLPVAARRRVMRLWLARRGVDLALVDRDQLEALVGPARLRGTKRFSLPGGVFLISRYGELDIAAGAAVSEPFRVRLDVPGETLLESLRLRVTTERSREVIKDRLARPGKLPAVATISASAVGRAALFVRSWRPGDRVRPLGMRGSKKLQDVFVDLKVERDRRACLPVVECRGEIVWVPGYCVARGWEVPADAASLHITMAPI